MNRKAQTPVHTTSLGVAILAFAVLMVACTSSPAPVKTTAEPAEAATTAVPQSDDNSKPMEQEVPAAVGMIQTDYTIDSLLEPIVQLEEVLLSADYFSQYLWGDWIFEDYLYRIFRLESGPYRPGEGSVLTITSAPSLSGTLHRALIQADDEGNSWWQVRHIAGEAEASYEIEVSAYGAPLRVRFVNPETGDAHERQTIVGGEIAWAVQNGNEPEAGLAFHEGQAAERATRNRDRLGDVAILGEELVRTSAGEFLAVHLSAVGDEAHYWVSPDVPGMIIRIAAGSGEDERVIAELTEITAGNRSEIDDSLLVEEDYLE